MCENGLIAPDGGITKYHLGRAHGEEAFNLYREEKVKQSDKAFFMQLGRVVDNLLKPEAFDALVNRLRESKDKRITDIPETLEATQKRLQLHWYLLSYYGCQFSRSRLPAKRRTCGVPLEMDWYARATGLKASGSVGAYG